MSEDREAIRELIHRHAQLTDDADVDARMALYAPDGRFTGPDGSVADGHAAVRAAFEKTAPSARGGKHITSNVVIDVDGDRATAFTDFAFFRVGTGGLNPFAAGRYHDTFVKQPDGWRFASRTIQILTPPPAPATP